MVNLPTYYYPSWGLRLCAIKGEEEPPKVRRRQARFQIR